MLKYFFASDRVWEHRCERMPPEKYVYLNEGASGQYWDTDDDIRPIFCPWCGLELLLTPEVEE